MAARKPKIGLLLGLSPGKGEPDEDDELREEEEAGGDVDPAVATQLTKAGIAEPEQQAAMVEAFRLCFEQWEREPHEEAGGKEG